MTEEALHTDRLNDTQTDTYIKTQFGEWQDRWWIDVTMRKAEVDNQVQHSIVIDDDSFMCVCCGVCMCVCV